MGAGAGRKRQMCDFCNVPIYLKTKQFARPLLAPVTREQELRDALLDLTGEVYLKLPHRFCPMCGEELKEDDLSDGNRKTRTVRR